MEGDVTAPPLSNVDIDEQSEQSFSDTLDKLCAYYMAMGVPCSEFWDGDYTLLKFYVHKHKIAVEQKNEELWLQGAYFYEAIATALANAFSKHSNAKYPEKPHRLTELSEEEKKIEQEKMVENFRAQLIAARDRFDAKHKREQGGEDLGSRKPGI